MDEPTLRRRSLLRSAGLAASASAPALGTASATPPAAPARDATVYVLTGGGDLYALDASTGERRWVFTEPAAYDAPLVPTGSVGPTVYDGTVYVGSGDGSVYGVDAATGEREWVNTDAGSVIDGAPSIASGTVFVCHGGSSGAVLRAIDAETGLTRWTFTDLSARATTPAVDDDTVYVTSHKDLTTRHRLDAVDVASGSLQWSFEVGYGKLRTAPSVVDGSVYAAGDSSVVSVDADSGSEEWADTFHGRAWSCTVAHGTVYCGTGSGGEYTGGLRAYDTATGARVESAEPGLPPESTLAAYPTVDCLSLYVATNGGLLRATDLAEGDRLWDFEDPSGDVLSSPTAFDGTVFVAAQAGVLYALDARDGSTVWRFDDPAEHVGLPTVVADPPGGHSVGTRASHGTLGHHTGDTATGRRAAGRLEVGVEVVRPENPDLYPEPYPIEPGDALLVRPELVNPGAGTVSQELEFRADGQVVATRDVTVEPCSTRSPRFVVDTDEFPTGTVEFTAASEDDAATYEWEVPVGEPPTFEVDVRVSPSQVDRGDEVTVVVTLENTGDVPPLPERTAGPAPTATLSAGGERIATRELAVGPGDRREWREGGHVVDRPPGEYEVVAATPHDEASTTLTVGSTADRLAGPGIPGALGGIASAGYLLRRWSWSADEEQ